jgi:hypothetical protein
MVRQVRAIWALLPILAAIDPGCLAESKSGSLCIAPAIFDPKDASAPGLYCKAEDFSLKIDAQALASERRRQAYRLRFEGSS